jgi:hypothetical protein
MSSNKFPVLPEEDKVAIRTETIAYLKAMATQKGVPDNSVPGWVIGYLKAMYASDIFTIGIKELTTELHT